MKPRRFSIGLYLLVLAFLTIGLVACDRSLEEREAQPTEPVDMPAESNTPVTGGERTPAPGETVVSVVTPVPESTSTGTEPTVVTVGETPPVAATAGTGASSPTAEPAPTQPAQSAPPAGQAGAVTHTVQQGETLSSIAQRYGTTWQVIANANGLQNPNQIYVGQKLTIRTGGATSGGATGSCRLRHTVQQGEWVWQIARRYGTSPYDILSANGLTIQSANTLYPGTVLCIP